MAIGSLRITKYAVIAGNTLSGPPCRGQTDRDRQVELQMHDRVLDRSRIGNTPGWQKRFLPDGGLPGQHIAGPNPNRVISSGSKPVSKQQFVGDTNIPFVATAHDVAGNCPAVQTALNQRASLFGNLFA